MFLLRAKNTYGEKKQPVYQVKKYSCLYIASVEMFINLGEDVSVIKKTVDRTVHNLNLKTLTGEPVQLVLNENGIIVQEHKYKDSQANDVLMAHALKRICYTTSFPKKRIYVFVSRLPQEERVFSHFFLMQDKSTGDKIIKELSNAFTNAFKTKKRKTLEKDHRRNLRAKHPVAPAPLPLQAPKPQASPKKKKNNPPPQDQFVPPPPYVDVLSNQDQMFQEFDIISPVNTPSAPPLSITPTGPGAFFIDNAFPLQQAQALPAYRNDPFIPQHAEPLYVDDPFVSQQDPFAPQRDPFAPQRENFAQIDIQQDPFSQFQIFPDSPNRNGCDAMEASDGLPSYNSYNKEFHLGHQVSKDDLLIDLTSPEHIPAPSGRLLRSLSTSNVLEEVRSDSPPFLPPAYQPPEHVEPIPDIPTNHQETAASHFRSRIGNQNEQATRPKSGIYPSLSAGLERNSFVEPFNAADQSHGFSYQDEHYALANEPWFQEGLPRDIIIELLKDQKQGAFFIRESLSQPGKLALSVKGSNNVIHFLIDKSRKGYSVENDKLFFPSISLLVMHHSINRGVLPCTLTVGDSNPAYLRADHLESSDSEAEGEDPIYTTYALTGSMNVQQH
ncbi:Src-like-adapter 2 [Oopsacas minuta]|uniref:Src-like-adapter 2 n=1 Tax=Oopsacas minuta TaxID=111878 RepID=A0AAV7K1F9_9METZ|nr:Src-like-adapter 2 [Oopsacas minuta]